MVNLVLLLNNRRIIMSNITIDDVLKAADEYRSSQDPSKTRWDLENAITNYAQAWADEQKADLEVKLAAEIEMREFNSKSQQHQRSEAQREKVQADNLNTEAHELSEKLIVCRREKKEFKESTDKALQAARLLCANLDNGGVGHKSLVENFRKLDEEVK
jgi:hypothetical protein